MANRLQFSIRFMLGVVVRWLLDEAPTKER
jgi:hypothetical protein